MEELESNYRYINMIIMYALCKHFVLYTIELLCTGILVSIMMCRPLEAIPFGGRYFLLISCVLLRQKREVNLFSCRCKMNTDRHRKFEDSKVSSLWLKYFVVSGHYPTHLYTWCQFKHPINHWMPVKYPFTADLFCPSFAYVLLLCRGIGLPRLNNRLLIYLLECRVWTWEHQIAVVAKKSQLTATWYLRFQDCKTQPVNRTLEGHSVWILMSHSDILLCLELCAALECTWIGVPVSTILFLDGSPIIICNDRESELNRKCPWAMHI